VSAGAGGSYPATFEYTGTVPGTIVVADSHDGILSRRVTPGPATITEAPTATPPPSITVKDGDFANAP
jgi:hypothetical protein